MHEVEGCAGSPRSPVAQRPAAARRGTRRYARTLCALLAPAFAAMFGTALADVAARNDSELKAALAAAPDAARGASLYGTCAACHGPDGGGVADGSIPAIAGQPQRVLVKQLADFRRSQRLDVRMEHFADRRHLGGAQDIADVAAYAATLSRTTAAGIGDGTMLAAGGRAWIGRCAGCHGGTGQANAARALPRLAGQHAAYLERQLLDTVAGRRPNMAATHRGVLNGLDPAEITGIADYLSRMK
ncbi:MAG: c-type cytochrome [Steroidobacteraceae bacterium]|jgi:cytochrome c553|nr:c-type cytochrome [Steroidobacteraceae bacterium]